MESLGDILYRGINLLFNNKLKADFEIECLTDLTMEQIDSLIKYYDIRGIILDVDETLRYNMCDIPIENDKWLDMINRKLRIVVVSNGYDSKIEKVLQNKGIAYISLAYKPFRRNFIRACHLLRLNPKNIAVIGDDMLSDIYGGNINNMTTIKVNSKKKKGM